MKIEYKNDGKGKHHSVTAYFEVSGHANAYGYHDVGLVGHGATEAEAKEQLEIQAKAAISALTFGQSDGEK